MYFKTPTARRMGWQSLGTEICDLNPKLILVLSGSREPSQSPSPYPTKACVFLFFFLKRLVFLRVVLGSQQNWAMKYRNFPYTPCPYICIASLLWLFILWVDFYFFGFKGMIKVWYSCVCFIDLCYIIQLLSLHKLLSNHKADLIDCSLRTSLAWVR